MLLQDILKTKGSVVYSIGPDATVADAVRELVARHVGALVVCQTDPGGSERLLGIISSAICSTPMPTSTARPAVRMRQPPPQDVPGWPPRSPS